MPKIGAEIDFTKRRARGQIKVCPKCGRIGSAAVVPFKSGPKMYVTHKTVFTGMSWLSTDFCMVPAPARSGQ
jgi:hypothetical protein